jgi:glutamate:Na+ symporter, ESS family
MRWPSRSSALALVSDLSLNVFLSMSLMSMQLWTLGGLGPSLVAFFIDLANAVAICWLVR